ncbi:MAG: hypothetical protein HXL56_01070, partial [Solobacterium sp.]|nr:hypothetical protein [Solobacterium sp.]
DLELFNGKHILAQAKSVVKSSTDFRNVREKLKAALKSLSEGNKNVDVEKLIYITNSYNPFNDDESKNIFWGETKRHFSLLPNTSKKLSVIIYPKLKIHLMKIIFIYILSLLKQIMMTKGIKRF